MNASIKVSKILALCFDATIRTMPESSTATAELFKLVTFKRNSRKFKRDKKYSLELKVWQEIEIVKNDKVTF